MKALNGGLFANDFLKGSIVALDEWQALTDETLDAFEHSLREVFDPFPTEQRPNESQTEDDLIWPVLALLGWTSSLRQQNLTPRGVDDVPDGLLFADEAAKARTNGFAEEWKRYEPGLAIVESKRWGLSLDARSDWQAKTAASTQMLRYLRRVDDVTSGRLRWGILTNGVRWRLYLPGGSVGLRGVLRDRSRSRSRPARTQRRSVRVGQRGAPPLAQSVRTPLPPGRIPSDRHEPAHLPSARA